MAALAANLAAAGVRNTATIVFDKIRAIRAKNDKQEQVNELEQIVRELIDDKSELAGIAQAYEQELIAQRISDQEIEYINGTVVPLLKTLVEQSGATNPETAANIEQVLDLLTSLLSVEALTVLQLVGFNFKQAIGEPLTLVLRQLIQSVTAKIPLDQQTLLDNSRINGAANVELLKIAQDEAASARLERLLGIWRG